MTFISGGRDNHQSSYFVRIIYCIHERQRGPPRMTNEDRALDPELRERAMKQLRLEFDGGVAVFRPLATTVARPIESDNFVTRRQRHELSHPILRGTRIAVNENDWATYALNNVVQTRAINCHESRSVTLRLYFGT